MKAWKIIGRILFALLVAVCIFSFAKFLFFTGLLDIQKIVLREGIFKVSNIDNEFEFDKLKNKPFDIVVRFYKQADVRYSILFSGKVPYEIDIELRDYRNEIVKRGIINQDSRMPKAYTNEYFEWTLMQFDAKKGDKYKVKINFNSAFKDYDKLRKEIYVEQYYDHPSAVWWLFFQRVDLIVFLITFIAILIIGLFYWRGRQRAKG
ncbi:MAG: hypothetical protein M1461_04995 [Nitrospirae bacterium]|nr:hypothetical protein [Nitrospirota bacterium]